ncbi:MAG TPA: hypothetical protein P5516_09660, partial [Anaerolineaceae bacterium]|nr:hypothetical protein [Anaerolineaceae bacterium]
IAAANPAAILELIRQRDELLAALKYARELVDDWGAYATAYMQEKHDLAGDLERLDAAISKVVEADEYRDSFDAAADRLLEGGE